METSVEFVCPRCEGPVSGVPLGCSACNLSFSTYLEVGPSFDQAEAHAKLLLSLGLKLPAPNLDDLARLLSRSSIKAGVGQGHALLAQHQGTLSAQGLPTRLVLSPRPTRGASSAASRDEAKSSARWAWIVVATFIIGVGFFFASQKSSGPADAEHQARSGGKDAPNSAPEGIDSSAVTKSIVSVQVATHSTVHSGTGFAIAPGLFLTNRHVIAAAETSGVQPVINFGGGKTADVQIEATSDRTDLALLSCEDPSCKAIPALPMRSPTEMKVGETVFAFGSPIGLELTMTRGILSHRARKILGTVYLQTDLAVNPGNSGGPLLDGGGHVVGVVTLKIGGAEGIAFALPIDYYVDVVKDAKLRREILDKYAVSAFRSEFVSMRDEARDLADEKPVARPPPPPPATPPPTLPRIQRAAAEEEAEEPGQPKVLSAEVAHVRGRGDVLVIRFELDVEPSEDLNKGVRLQLEIEEGTPVSLGATSPALRRVSDGLVHYRFEVEVPVDEELRRGVRRPARLRVNDDRLSRAFKFTRR